MNTFDTDARRWRAVERRDGAADNVFVYSVRTTGVYCRPSCASRLAKRENVRFHDSCAAAERAGFRPCKRCTPNAASPAERQQDAVTRACRLIESADAVPSLADLAAAAGMSAFHFHRVFKSLTGLTPKAYAKAHRANRVRSELAGSATVTEAIYGSGFNSNGRFYATAATELGMTPTTYRTGGAGEVIRFALGRSSLGFVLVAATGRGVCAIFLGDDPDELTRELADRFPHAKLTVGDADFDRWVALAVALVEQPARGCDLPLDIRGTAFQRRVWDALRQIPPGTTATYTDIARRIGHPTAVRAVGAACGANHIAIIIPCHRVVRTDESLAGYYWGVKRKAELLKRERKN